ncbi:MAG: deoxyribodipyrimidine photo-lyase [Pseudomonadota bacterium]
MPDASREKNHKRPALVWFRDDLRLADHPALSEAVKSGQPVICLYILDETTPGIRPLGGAAKWWLAGSLRALSDAIEKRGATLTLRHGAAKSVIADVVRETGAGAIYWNRRYDGGAKADTAVEESLVKQGIAVRTFQAALLHEPPLLGKSGKPLQVFTPFWRALQETGTPRAPLAAPKKIAGFRGVTSDKLESWHLEPIKPNWASGMCAFWAPGEVGARNRLSEFLDDELAGYATQRDRPDIPGTSRLSPHLRFGEISPFQVWHAAKMVADSTPARVRDVEKFLSEIGWREFCYHLLCQHPDLAAKNIDKRFDKFPWRADRKAIKAWQKGETGYPIVDAGMRQLWQTGWMHNRVRMVVASFLVKHLLIDWREGEQWFWDTLVDADPANNPASWQWVAGCGADAAPYFRVFNPTIQSEKFDPKGDYVRKFVPEFADAGTLFAKSYPKPIVDHKAARERALKAFASLKN